MKTNVVYWDYIGIMEKKMETTMLLVARHGTWEDFTLPQEFMPSQTI